jgi:hypothetical protein
MTKRISSKKALEHAEQAILRTLLYSDFFAFPLNAYELWRYLKNDNKISKQDFVTALKKLAEEGRINNDGYYSIPEGKSSTEIRKKRTIISRRKLLAAKRISKLLQTIPTIFCIGISGSLASLNADTDADIDFFLIVAPGTVWSTRLVVLGLLALTGKRRKKNDRITHDKCCVNMIVSADALHLPSDRHDVYTAHEIAQLLPLFEKRKTYQRFLFENAWITRFLPNISLHKPDRARNNFSPNPIIKLFNLWDKIAKKLQIYSIEKTVTNETISDNLLAFHPDDHRIKIIKRYKTLVSKIPQ